MIGGAKRSIGLLRAFRSQVVFLTNALCHRNPRPRPHFRSFDLW